MICSHNRYPWNNWWALFLKHQIIRSKIFLCMVNSWKWHDQSTTKRSLGKIYDSMMTSSNGNIFRVTVHLCEDFTGHRWIPAQRPVTRSFDVFFDLRLIKRLSKQLRGWWFETPLRSLWSHCNAVIYNHVIMTRMDIYYMCLNHNWFISIMLYEVNLVNFSNQQPHCLFQHQDNNGRMNTY